MLRLFTTLFKPDPKYKRELKAAALLLAAGYVLLLVLVYLAFNDSEDSGDAQADRPASQIKSYSYDLRPIYKDAR